MASPVFSNPAALALAASLPFAPAQAQTPAYPTIAEAGVPGYGVDNGYGIFMPGATSKAVAVKTQEAIGRIIQEPETRKMMLAQGLDVASSHEEFVKAFPAEILKWSKVVQAIGLDLKQQRTTQPRRWCDE